MQVLSNGNAPPSLQRLPLALLRLPPRQTLLVDFSVAKQNSRNGALRHIPVQLRLYKAFGAVVAKVSLAVSFKHLAFLKRNWQAVPTTMLAEVTIILLSAMNQCHIAIHKLFLE